MEEGSTPHSTAESSEEPVNARPSAQDPAPEATPNLGLSNGRCGGGPLSDLYQWREITRPFLEATKELVLGELLHDDMFGLFEAMSAIEMMDPKMDAGMLCNRQNRKPHSFQSAKESGYLQLRDIEPAHQIAIIDQTLACLVTWLEGHSLAQTVFTNLYLHSPFEIEDPIIKATAIFTLKLIDVIRDILSRGSVYEEEDFQPLVYNFKLCEEISPHKAGAMLREVEDDLQRVLRSTKSKTDAQQSKEHTMATALHARIRFCRMFYLALISLVKHDIPEGQRQLTSALEQVKTMASTTHLGTQVDISKENPIGFERLANQRLLPPTFPRYTEIKSNEDAVEFFQRTAEHLLEATNVTQLNTFPAVLEFFINFSAQPTCVVSRSMLQLLYQPLYMMSQVPGVTCPADRKNVPLLQDLLKDACRAFIAPPALTSSSLAPFNTIEIKNNVDSFFNQCCRPMGLLLQTFGHNQARRRDKIATLLEEFAAIQEVSDKLDDMLNSLSQSSDGPRPHMLFFSTWLLYHVLRLMVRYLLSGFELELYSTHEYPYLYWYLYELLFPWLITCLHRADTNLVEHEQLAESLRNAGKNKKKVKNANKKKTTVRPYSREITLFQGRASLCAGYFKLMVALKKESKILVPDPTFDNEAVRYEHRFLPFASLFTPPIMPYCQFLEVHDHTAKSPSSELLLAASKDFLRSRQIFETILTSSVSTASTGTNTSSNSVLGQNLGNADDVASLVSVCKNNCVVAGILSRDSSRNVSFDFSTNSTFPSVKLT